MRFWLFLIMCTTFATHSLAEILVPVRTIRAKEILRSEDLAVKQVDMISVLSDPTDAVGLEARVALYPDRPLRPGDLGPPAIVERNDLVTLIYVNGGLRIVTDGRSLGRGAAGEMLRVMNLQSRSTIFGQIRSDGMVEVQ